MAKALAYFMTVGVILLFMLTILSLALPLLSSRVSSVPPVIVVNRTDRSDTHIQLRHGLSGLGAMAAVRWCPKAQLIAYLCPDDFQKPLAIALGCPLEGGGCAFCFIATDGRLLTCYTKRTCQMPSCEPIPPPTVEFPAICGYDADQGTGCASEREFFGGNLYVCGFVGVPCEETEE